MSRLVVVSNRVADPRKPGAGGLAVAVGEALKKSGGLWFGWSGRVVDDGAGARAHVQRAGNVTLATVDLSREDHDAYYLGYSNSVLWPVFHHRLDLADFEAADVDGYRRVNRSMAARLAALLEPDDLLWVHDYHLIPLAAELRALGCAQRIGFFLHIPLPPRSILAAIPHSAWLVRSLLAYDLVAFQSQMDLDHFAAYIEREAEGSRIGEERFHAWSRTVRAAALPIGIDVDEFQALGRESEAQQMRATLRQEYADRQLLIGVDRLDYSKGLPQRIKAFRRLLERYPENRHSAVLIQITAPSRESVDAYADIRAQLDSLSGAVNGDYGDLDWMPVRYLRRTVARKRLPGLYAAARVALVTPLRDGMNLVAKEYVAAQDPADPGVLVLSRFAGAAEQMADAVIVNPYDIDGCADAIQLALRMPLAERQVRHRRLLEGIRRQDVHWWAGEFLQRLEAVDDAG